MSTQTNHDDPCTNSRYTERATLLLKQLKEYRRAPRGLLQSWQEIQQVCGKSVAKIFLEEGQFPTWFAYFLFKSAAENQCHFTGKADYRRLIADLEGASTEENQALAREVAGRIEPDLREKVERLRRKVIELSGHGDMSPKQSKRRRTNACNLLLESSSNPSSPSETLAIAPLLPLDCIEEHGGITVDSSDCFAEDKHVLVNASLTETTSLFPPYLSGAIKRIADPCQRNAVVAAIALTFPNSPVTDKFGCQMALDITDNKVEHIAKELFDVHLETTAGLRYVYLPGGAKVLPNPKLTLRGCRYDIISSVFGPHASSAIAASPTYQDDIKQGRDRTGCVSMVISHRALEGAIIFASLGPREGTLIGDRLYG